MIFTRIILTKLIFIIPFYVLSQHGNLKGLIVDSETGEGVPFATVALIPEGTETPAYGTTSDFEGHFLLTGVAAKKYTMAISFIGYSALEMKIEVEKGHSQMDLGSLLISPALVNLDEVEVSAMAQTASNRLDRRSYRAEDFETARGGTAADLMNRLPSVAVSPDGEVSVRGTTDFIVYLNGKPTQIDPSVLLAQLPASSIVGVDVITVPTASFDAQGKGGIINISTKSESLHGFSLSTTATIGAAPWGNRREDLTGHQLKDDRYGGGISAVYSQSDWTLFAGLHYNWRDANTNREGVARILDKSTGAYKHMLAAGLKPEWYENMSANLGIDRMLSDKSSISSSYYFGKQLEGRTAYYQYHTFFGDVDQNFIPGLDPAEIWTLNPNTGIRKGEFHTANVDYSFNTAVSALNLGALYEYSVLSHIIDNPNIALSDDRNILADTLSHFKQADRTPLHGLRFTIDYQRKYDNGNVFSLGFHPQYFNISGGFDYDTLDVLNRAWAANAGLENAIDLSRWIYAGYADLSGQLNKLQFKAGLRLEYTDQSLNIENTHYITLLDQPTSDNFVLQQLDWFPSLHASYPVSDRDKLNFAASRRISRAPVKNMAPFLYRRHLEVYVVGDPSLKPEYINTIELSYSKGVGNQQFNLLGFYRGVDNAVFRVNTVYDEEQILIRSFTNAGTTKATGAELNANLMIGNSAKFFLGASLYNYHIKAEIFGYQEDQQSLNWNLKGNANIALNDQLSFVADFNIRSAEVTAQGEDGMRAMANISMSYVPKGWKGWSFTLRGMNILDSNTRGVSTRAYDQEGVQIFYQDTDYYWYGPIAELSVSYNLNWQNQSKDKPDRSFGRDEF